MRELELRELQRRLMTFQGGTREGEQHSLRSKRRVIRMMVCVVTLGVMGAWHEKPTTIEAREFMLRDENGLVRASWTIRPDGTPGFGLFDKSGRVRLSVDMSPEGDASFNLHDRFRDAARCRGFAPRRHARCRLVRG